MLAAAPALAQEKIAMDSAKAKFVVETMAAGLENPWSIAFLPDGRKLITERPGRLRILDQNGKLSDPVAGVPPVAAVGQGGLLDVALAPDFAKSQRIYFSFAEPRGVVNGTAVAHGRLTGQGGVNKLEDVKVVFRQEPGRGGGFHFGSRLAFAPDGNLFVTLGERNAMSPAQDLTGHLGKVVRIRPDGSVPPDNPFANREDVRPEIWSYGHRNPQAAAIHPSSGRLWEVEHGARGGDEITRVRRSARARTRKAWSSRSTIGIPRSRRRAWPSIRATRFPPGGEICSLARWCCATFSGSSSTAKRS
jgi:glucose/arabinose dehydrogenase